MTPQQTTWALEREKAYELFGGASPFESDDTDIAATFAQHPTQVIAEIARIADAYQNGKVHTPWRALHSRLAKIARDAQPVSLTADTRLRLAENWIRNAGLYCSTEAEVCDELFSSHGLLAGQASAFEARLLTLWRHEQPRVQLAQADLEERAVRWKQGQEALAKAKSLGSEATGAQPVADDAPTSNPPSSAFPMDASQIPEDAGPPDDDWGET